MNEAGVEVGRRKLQLILLPGMDGTGDLFTEFVSLLPTWIAARAISYPRHQRLSYEELRRHIVSSLPTSEPFVILAESFSSPLGVEVASHLPKNLKALIICAGFVTPPVGAFARCFLRVCAPLLFAMGPFPSAIRHWLIGHDAPPHVVDLVRSTISGVSPAVLTDRLRSVCTCDHRKALRQVKMPLLYIAASEDRLIKRRSWEEFAMLPEAQCVVINGPHLIAQANPVRVAQAVSEFLGRRRAFR